MNAMPIIQGTPAWLEARKKGIGGSDAAAVVGLSPFQSSLELYLVKCGESPDKPETEAMRWGKVLESAIATEYAERQGVQIEQGQALMQSAEHPFMLASLDGVVQCPIRGEGGYEGKSLSAWTKLDDGLPEYIWIQVQHCMCVSQLNWFDVAMLLGGQRFELRTVERDDEAIEMLIDAEREFMRRVEIGDPPPPDGMASTGSLLRRMYPEGNGRTIILDDPAAIVEAQRIDALALSMKEMDSTRKALCQKFQQRMAKSEVAVIPGYGQVTWKTTRYEDTISIDAERLSLEEPEMYARFATTTPKRSVRRFMTKPIKKSEKEDEEDE